MKTTTFNDKVAKYIGEELGIDWKEVRLEEFTKGMNVELEHGKLHPETNLSNDDPLITGKIAWAHLMECPDYYTRLEKMEKEAHLYWKDREALLGGEN